MLCRISLFGCLCLVVIAGRIDSAVAQTAPSPEAVDYNRDIRPILSDRCFRCHGPDAERREADLRLDRREDAVSALRGFRAVVPGKSAESEAYRRITSIAPTERMPPADSGLVLSATEISLLKRWIDEGAKYQAHWAFVAPQPPALPSVDNDAWSRNSIDHFVLACLQKKGLKPSPEASREKLLRRVTLDLTGLPPTLKELDAFLADKSPDAYEKVVDRLLQSNRYGERMALDWLDAARYADTNGYYTDAERQAWPWRDWVIKAFNRNMPFDRFTTEQLAGDLLPKATVDQKIATGFSRNHMVTNESGVIDEEARVGYVVDRVDTMTTVWLGLTVGCARCHDHKYDPVTQKEYYELFACFNNVPETGLVKDPMSPPPSISLPTPEQERQLAKLREQLAKCQSSQKADEPALKSAIAQWERTALSTLAPIATTGNIAHFDFNDQGQDTGPNEVHASITGMLKFEPGIVGSAAKFDGTQYVEFATAPKLDTATPFTLTMWVKPGSSPSGCVMSKMASTADARGFEIIWYKAQPRINLVHEWGRSAIEVTAQEKFPNGEWRHLGITYDGSGKAAGINVFVDGRTQPINVKRDSLSGSIATPEPWRIAWKGMGVGFEGSIDEVRLYQRVLQPHDIHALYWRDMLQGGIETPPAKRSRQQAERIRSYYITHLGTDDQRRLMREVSALRNDEADLRKLIISTAVMQEMEKPRATHLLVRGQYDQPGQKVTPGVPAVLGKLSADLPRNRLGLASWLVSPDHPLTARVTVNRYWQMVFGDGLVRTVNDFGLQGEQPSHPELLDWLAVHFVKSGWDVKALMKLLVTSATYRQSSNFTPDLLQRDPDNRLLARGPRYRMPPELIRDQALASSGLLVEKIGGPSVKPYQPSGLWEAVSYNGDQTYVQDHGDGLHRRSLYTFWKRQAPPPAMLTFDGPTREICTVRRARTNTPLQALVLLNDVTYVEAARGLAARIMREGGREVTDRVKFGFRSVTGRLPTAGEVTGLKKFYDGQLTAYRARPQAAAGLLKTGEAPIDPELDARELAAWTMLASVLLNLDETITQH